MRRLTALGVAVLVTTSCSSTESGMLPLGFSSGSAEAQRSLEQRLISRADPARVREVHRELTRLPHPAGSVRDRELADWIARQYTEAGLEDVRVTTHEVLVPRPLEVGVEMTQPDAWRAEMRDTGDGAPAPSSPSPQEMLPYHAFSASGEVTAPVVYAGPGTPADYEWLARRGVDVKGRIVLVHSTGVYRYRGLAAFTAEQSGAAGVLMFTVRDKAGAASAPGLDAAAMRGIERGSILYDFFYPGDPETPGWPSLPGAKRLSRSEVRTLPRIINTPLSAVDARLILSTLGGPIAPEWWGRDAARSQVGPGPPVRVKVRLDEAVRPVWTVTGMLRGREEPDSIVVVGNHRDAWVFGGVDPSTGTASMLELVRVLGTLRREGWSPKRSLLFASWDAEELGLTSSTEWAEQHAEWLRSRAVAYLNVDSAASGSRFVAGGSPSLLNLIAGAAGAVADPSSGVPVLSAERGRDAEERGVQPGGRDSDVIADRLGGGSDYTVFLNHLGVPSADLGFDGDDWAYHTTFDTHEYVDRVADPGFRYTTTMTRVLGIAAARLASADVVPIDPMGTAAATRAFWREIEPRVPRNAANVQAVEAAIDELERAAQAFGRRRDSVLGSGDPGQYQEMNRRLLQLERSFIDDRGLPGREWYKHVLMAPARSYQPLVLPGVLEALESADTVRFASQAERLAAALLRAASLLDGR
jgi:N-acetylated-alpha-linked acidic dipeptidase